MRAKQQAPKEEASFSIQPGLGHKEAIKFASSVFFSVIFILLIIFFVYRYFETGEFLTLPFFFDNI